MCLLLIMRVPFTPFSFEFKLIWKLVAGDEVCFRIER